MYAHLMYFLKAINIFVYSHSDKIKIKTKLQKSRSSKYKLSNLRIIFDIFI